MKFKAEIIGAIPISEGTPTPINTVISFTKNRVHLKDDQINKIYLDPYLVNVVSDKMKYEFDKRLNKDDEKMFSIILNGKLYHLKISFLNKIKANIIHDKYWLYNERDWFAKTILSVVIGALIAGIFSERGYKQGYREGLKAGQEVRQDTLHK